MRKNKLFSVVYAALLASPAFGAEGEPSPSPTPCEQTAPCPPGVDRWEVGGPFTVTATLKPTRDNKAVGDCSPLSQPDAILKARSVLADKFNVSVIDHDFHYTESWGWTGQPTCSCVDTGVKKNVLFDVYVGNLVLNILESPQWHIKGIQPIKFEVEDDTYWTNFDDGSAETTVQVDVRPPCWPDSIEASVVQQTGHLYGSKYGHYLRVCGSPSGSLHGCILYEEVFPIEDTCSPVPVPINYNPFLVQVTGGTEGPGPDCLGDEIGLDLSPTVRPTMALCEMLPCRVKVEQIFHVACSETGPFREVYRHVNTVDLTRESGGDVKMCFSYGGTPITPCDVRPGFCP